MSVATTFYEKYIPADKYENHLEQLAQIGYKSIEFLPHERCIPLKMIKMLTRKAKQLKLQTAFHSPDFLDPLNYQPAFFDTHPAVKKNFEQLFQWIVDDADGTFDVPFVIHSANYLQSGLDSDAVKTTNLRFFDWLANFIERQRLPVRLCLENTYSAEEACCLKTIEDYIDFFKQMKGAPLSLCLDLPHWWRQCLKERKAPEILFDDNYELLLTQIIYCHLHGIDEKTDKSHLKLNSEHSRFLSFVKAFSDKKTQINFNLEIFDLQAVANLTTYESVLQQQLQLVNTILYK